MRKIQYSLTEFIYDQLTSHRAKTAWMAFCAIAQLLIRIFILLPLIIFCCLVFAVLTTVPVAVFISPSFTPDVLAQGILRVMHLLPGAYTPLCVAGALFELVYLIRRFTVLPDFWPDDAAQGKGR
ncbi:hypothetical protein [Kosakonia sp. MUSA4]|uniref:hypothetical protein n=1 Tax=Kosakonia sp. MUSA4 TaxID=2067958 RepID=UPI0015975737|nr:hypothetical protein [Kosakonia sp. MUSA4]QJT82586.1 hypothetical protein C0557_22160 [Kosakonia sp. MUSA4]